MSVPGFTPQHHPAQQPSQSGQSGGGEDLFAPDGPKRRSVSFKDAPVGAQYRWQVIDTPAKVQSIDYYSKEPAFWDAEKTQPKMSIVVGVRDLLAGDGEELGLWMKYRSALHRAISEASARSGVPIVPGTIIDAQVTGYLRDPARPQAQPARQFQAQASAGTPPTAAAENPFAGTAPQAQQSGWNQPPTSAPPQWAQPQQAQSAQQPQQFQQVPTLPASPVASAYAPPVQQQAQQAQPVEQVQQSAGVLAAAAELGLNL